MSLFTSDLFSGNLRTIVCLKRTLCGASPMGVPRALSVLTQSHIASRRVWSKVGVIRHQAISLFDKQKLWSKLHEYHLIHFLPVVLLDLFLGWFLNLGLVEHVKSLFYGIVILLAPAQSLQLLERISFL